MKHNFQLLNGNFSPSEASDVLLSMVKSNINFYKVQSLSFHEMHDSDMTIPFGQIESLQNIDNTIRTLIKEANEKGLQLKINGFIEVSAS